MECCDVRQHTFLEKGKSKIAFELFVPFHVTKKTQKDREFGLTFLSVTSYTVFVFTEMWYFCFGTCNKVEM